VVDVRPDVAEAYDAEIQDRLSRSAWTGCDSWYVDGGRITTNWPGLVREYQQRTATVDWSELAAEAGPGVGPRISPVR
jgi:hypothetical protein